MTMPGYTLTYLGPKVTTTLTESGTTTTTHGYFKVTGSCNGTMSSAYVNSSALGVSHEVGIHTNWLRPRTSTSSSTSSGGNQDVLLQGAREAAREPASGSPGTSSSSGR